MPGLSPGEIALIESQLGCDLPDDVRKAYASSDGVLGPANCRLLYQLESEYGIVRANKMLKSEDWFPRKFRSFAILGDDGCGNLICFNPTVPEVVIWNPADGDWIQQRRATVSELWNFVREQYANDA